jgi:alpha-glucosidase
VYRRWRALADACDPPRVLVGEVNLDPARAARYTRPGELHQTFAFGTLTVPWDAAAWARVGAELLAARPPGGGPVTWVTENHDVVRSPTRYAPIGSAPTGELRTPPRRVPHPAPASSASDPGELRIPPRRVAQPDTARGTARARAAVLAVLGLPGGAYLYQGQELGLPEVDVPEAARQDPMWARGGISRDGCRVPVPWRRGPAGAFGFSARPDAVPWLPVPDGWGALSVEAAEADPASTLHLCRAALTLRRRLHRSGVLAADDAVVWEVDGGRLVARRGRFVLVVAMGEGAVPLPRGPVALASAPVVDGWLPADAAAWVLAD